MDYTPIDCSFHDQLLLLATTKQAISIRYYLDSAEVLIEHTVIKDVYTAKTKEEFLVLNSGQEIRLDHLVKVGNYSPPENNKCAKN